eukprot:CAMPEP_0116029870 /NCGR_PEP_ID=MMETSP0321-20121206/16428_1 /TAXON_ID=163516 /ORGANISM="Leptocylindrus danicus var. danicus, Strain B650" /LENGTH=466 /DNA_ID=CAMNT_0003504391 /DNA_START=568 /DNA_END=1968 /DNA_ORIENTATION=+
MPKKKTGKRKKSKSVVEQDHHFLSIYRHKRIDFKELAAKYGDFDLSLEKLKKRRKEAGVKNKGACFSTHVDFDFNSSLTRALLRHDFGVELPVLPEGTLCPPVPNRLNYVCWIRELLNCFVEGENEFDLQAGNEHCQGIDIGTGASCIYPLLICTARDPKDGELLFPKWRMLATDIEPASVSCALKNVNANSLGQRIHVHLEEAMEVRKGDGRSRTDMTFSEGVYQHGGELGFVKSILKDSFRIQNRIRWYTSMFARKSSLVAMENILREAGLGYRNIKTTRFQQGKTARFGIAWTFSVVPLRSVAARVSNNVFSFQVSTNYHSQLDAIDEVTSRICTFCDEFRKMRLEYNIIASQDSRIIDISVATTHLQDAKASVTGEIKFPLSAHHADVECNDALLCLQLRSTLPNQEENGCIVEVSFKCYSRSKEGNQIISTVQHILQSEVTRTNRKWKRLKKDAEARISEC